jgi:hypothetical protein
MLYHGGEERHDPSQKEQTDVHDQMRDPLKGMDGHKIGQAWALAQDRL